MTTQRKITLGLSYLRSACADIALSRPSTADCIRTAISTVSERFSLLASDFSPKCYNKSRKI